MLKRLLARSVRLDIGVTTLELRSAKELELALSGRTGLSSPRIAALGALSDEALRREETALESMEHSIVNALARSARDGDIDSFLRDLDLSTIADDNGWRGVFAAVGGLDAAHHDYKRTALVKYAAYLASGREFLRAIRSNREGLGIIGGEAGPQDLGPRQALIFDLDVLLGAEPFDVDAGDAFTRLSKGESIDVELTAHQSLSLKLGKHRFTLVAGSPCLLLDENGNDYRLRPGKNIIGRSTQCDVAVDPVFRAVSRRHLIAEIGTRHDLRLTDISTLGTFVPRGPVDSRLH